MYGDSHIATLKLLLTSSHPGIDRLFHRARTGKLSLQDRNWSMKCGLGHNNLCNMMAIISSSAGLLQWYTNHCLGGLVVTKLKQAGLEVRKICRITSHKDA